MGCTDGSPANVVDFANMAAYRNGNSIDYANYGVYRLGNLPGTPQVGSDIQPFHQGGVDYVAFDVPAQQPIYLTALWQAPAIGSPGW